LRVTPMFKLNSIFHKSKPRLPNPAPNLKLVFKGGAIGQIKEVKGWRTDREMAEALGITRAYVSMLAARRVSVSHNVILRLAYLLGSVSGKWWVHYEIVNSGEPIDPDHPIWNQEKYQGRMPYGRFSSSAELRKKDYKVEVRTLGQEFQRNGKVRKHK
jgi:transcriptional regulator with XRE-family HTH domain